MWKVLVNCKEAALWQLCVLDRYLDMSECKFLTKGRLFVGTTQQIKDGSLVRKCRVADRMGSIIFSVWNEESEAVDTGDIIRLTRG